MSIRASTLNATRLAPFIEQVGGDAKGKIYELGSDQISIGRGAGNDIVIQSEAISRCHAYLVKSDEGWFVKDNNSKNGVHVNGDRVSEGWLQNGDIVQVGDFVFRFNAPQIASDPFTQKGGELQVAYGDNSQDSLGMGMDVGVGMQGSAMPSMDLGSNAEVGLSSMSKKKKGPNRRVLLYGVLGLVLAAVFLMDSGDKSGSGDVDGTETPKGRLSEQAVANLDKNVELSKPPKDPKYLEYDPATGKQKSIIGLEDPQLSRAEQQMKELDWSNSALKEAESFFKKGQREYLNGNLHRSIDNFQTSLTLYRGHALAERYLKRAIYSAELKSKEQMAIGIRYFDSLQYQRAIHHFKEAIALMKHRPNEPLIEEAKRYIKQSELRLQAAELFP